MDQYHRSGPTFRYLAISFRFVIYNIPWERPVKSKINFVHDKIEYGQTNLYVKVTFLRTMSENNFQIEVKRKIILCHICGAEHTNCRQYHLFWQMWGIITYVGLFNYICDNAQKCGLVTFVANTPTYVTLVTYIGVVTYVCVTSVIHMHSSFSEFNIKYQNNASCGSLLFRHWAVLTSFY